MRALAILAALLLACGDNKVPPAPPQGDAAPDSPVVTPSGPCTLDRPDELPRPPIDNQLPCELFPPGFVAP